MIPVFEATPEVAFRLQDEIRVHMLKSAGHIIKDENYRAKAAQAGGVAKALKAERRRQEIAAEVLDLRSQGLAIHKLSAQFRVSEESIKVILNNPQNYVAERVAA